MQGSTRQMREPMTWPYMIISGHAKLPNEAVLRAAYESLAVVAAVDLSTGRVLDVDCTFVTATARRFVTQLLVGVDLRADSVEVFETLQDFYWGGAKKALVGAVRDLYAHWNAAQGESSSDLSGDAPN